MLFKVKNWNGVYQKWFSKNTFQSYACNFFPFFKNFCKNGITLKKSFFFANTKCFAKRTLLSCINSFISFLLFAKVQKSHKLHSHKLLSQFSKLWRSVELKHMCCLLENSAFWPVSLCSYCYFKYLFQACENKWLESLESPLSEWGGFVCWYVLEIRSELDN